MIFILLPAYNEEESINVLFPKIEKLIRREKDKYQLIVCDDGSDDKTETVLKNFSKKFQ